MIYLASPYTHPDPAIRQQRFVAVCKATAAMTRNGEHVFSPIAHSHPLVEHGGLTDVTWDFWEKIDHNFIELCSDFSVLTLPGWEGSIGVSAEIEFAKNLGRTITYLHPETLTQCKKNTWVLIEDWNLIGHETVWVAYQHNNNPRVSLGWFDGTDNVWRVHRLFTPIPGKVTHVAKFVRPWQSDEEKVYCEQ